MKKRVIISLVLIGIFILLGIIWLFLINGLPPNKEIYNINVVNEKVRNEISKLIYASDKNSFVYLPNFRADIIQGKEYGVAFAVKNILNETEKFNYQVVIPNPERVSVECKISEDEALSFITNGKEGFFSIAPGEFEINIIRFEIPKNAPLCFIRYKFKVTTKANENYSSNEFDISIR